MAPPGGSKSFEFTGTRVFGRDGGTAPPACFGAISHLVAPCADGYKVCIFTYGHGRDRERRHHARRRRRDGGGRGGGGGARRRVSLGLRGSPRIVVAAPALIREPSVVGFSTISGRRRAVAEENARTAAPIHLELRVTSSDDGISTKTSRICWARRRRSRDVARFTRRHDGDWFALRARRWRRRWTRSPTRAAPRTSASTLMNDHSSRSSFTLALD